MSYSFKYTRYAAVSGFICLLILSACSDNALNEQVAELSDPKHSSFLMGKSDIHGIAEDSDEARGVLRLVNEASFEVLHSSEHVGLDRRAAQSIMDYRQGGDGEYGTQPVNAIESLRELDQLYYVGPVAFERLLHYAREHGFIIRGLGQIIVPGTVVGRFGWDSPKNTYTFRAQANSVWNIALNAYDGPFADLAQNVDVHIGIYGPESLGWEHELASATQQAGSDTVYLENVLLPETGTYLVVITSSEQSLTANYELDFSCATGGGCAPAVPTNLEKCEEGVKEINLNSSDFFEGTPDVIYWNTCNIKIASPDPAWLNIAWEIPQGKTLIIHPGVTVELEYTNLKVSGALKVLGTEAHPVHIRGAMRTSSRTHLHSSMLVSSGRLIASHANFLVQQLHIRDRADISFDHSTLETYSTTIEGNSTVALNHSVAQCPWNFPASRLPEKAMVIVSSGSMASFVDSAFICRVSFDDQWGSRVPTAIYVTDTSRLTLERARVRTERATNRLVADENSVVHLNHADIEGIEQGGHSNNEARGIVVRTARLLRIENSVVHRFFDGVYVDETYTTLRNSNIHSNKRDGLHITGPDMGLERLEYACPALPQEISRSTPRVPEPPPVLSRSDWWFLQCPYLTNVDLHSNGRHGLYMASAPELQVHDSNISNNGSVGVMIANDRVNEITIFSGNNIFGNNTGLYQDRELSRSDSNHYRKYHRTPYSAPLVSYHVENQIVLDNNYWGGEEPILTHRAEDLGQLRTVVDDWQPELKCQETWKSEPIVCDIYSGNCPRVTYEHSGWTCELKSRGLCASGGSVCASQRMWLECTSHFVYPESDNELLITSPAILGEPASERHQHAGSSL